MDMNKRIFYLLSLTIALLISACSEDTTSFVYGDVIDGYTGELIEGCQITLQDAQGQSVSTWTTGEDGRWGFEVEVGEYILVFTKDDYQTVREEDVVVLYENTRIKIIARLGEDFSETDFEKEWTEEEPEIPFSGSGSKKDPYLIKTINQLRMMKDFPKSHFKLANNIDLYNKNWMPIKKFSGKLDGNGYTIYNLRIEREDKDCSYRGLIGSLYGGSIVNLTIEGVKINGNNAGAIVGEMNDSQISNCRVVLKTDSELKGKEYIGGIVGTVKKSGNSIVENCVVEYIGRDSKNNIMGEKYTGGIAGAGQSFTGCRVLNCNIVGEEYVGGIVGNVYTEINNSEYLGNLGGSKYVGGISGYAENKAYIFSCKSMSDIDCDDDFVGGVCGNGGESVACYAGNSITCTNITAQHVSGISNGAINLCYSTILCEHRSFQPKGTERIIHSYSIYDTHNIAQSMEESYSDYAEYWNFEYLWIWEGLVNGRNKQVKCPRLAWE